MDLYQYLATSSKSSPSVDGIYMVLTAQFLRCNLMVIWSGGVWSSHNNLKHDIKLVFKGNQAFYLTAVGIFILLTCYILNSHYFSLQWLFSFKCKM